VSVPGLLGLLQKGDDGQDEEDNKENLGDPCRGACDETEAKDRGDDGDDEKNEGVVEHIILDLV